MIYNLVVNKPWPSEPYRKSYKDYGSMDTFEQLNDEEKIAFLKSPPVAYEPYAEKDMAVFNRKYRPRLNTRHIKGVEHEDGVYTRCMELSEMELLGPPPVHLKKCVKCTESVFDVHHQIYKYLTSSFPKLSIKLWSVEGVASLPTWNKTKQSFNVDTISFPQVTVNYSDDLDVQSHVHQVIKERTKTYSKYHLPLIINDTKYHIVTVLLHDIDIDKQSIRGVESILSVEDITNEYKPKS